MLDFDKIETCLAEAYRVRGDLFLSDNTMVKGILHDLLPRDGRERRMLEFAIDEGVLMSIEQYRKRGGDVTVYARNTSKLLTDTGFVEDTAARALVNSLFVAICGVRPLENELKYTEGSESNETSEIQKEVEQKDFEIQDGALVKYHGVSEEVWIPEGVVKIGEEAFKQNRKVKR